MNESRLTSLRAQMGRMYVNIADQDPKIVQELVSSPTTNRRPISLIMSALTHSEVKNATQMCWPEQSHQPSQPIQQSDCILFRLQKNRNACSTASELTEDKESMKSSVGELTVSNIPDKVIDVDQPDILESTDPRDVVKPMPVSTEEMLKKTNNPSFLVDKERSGSVIEENHPAKPEPNKEYLSKCSKVRSEMHAALLEEQNTQFDESQLPNSRENDPTITTSTERPMSECEKMSLLYTEKSDAFVLPHGETDRESLLPNDRLPMPLDLKNQSQTEAHENVSEVKQKPSKPIPDVTFPSEQPPKSLSKQSSQHGECIIDLPSPPEELLIPEVGKISEIDPATERQLKTASTDQDSVPTEADRKPENSKTNMEDKPSAGQPLQPKACKITNAAQWQMNHLRRVLIDACEDLSNIQENLLRRDFAECVVFYNRVLVVPTIMARIIGKLDYSPFEKDLWQAHDCLMRILTDVKTKPSQILPRLVELGFYIFEFGDILGAKIVPEKFATQVHAIQARIHRLSTGKVIRQIIYVPRSFDSVVSNSPKDRRLERVEKFCFCQVQMLNPTHPRAALCPPGCRTLDVHFDPVRGRYIGFHGLLDRCLHPKRRVSRIALTVLRRPDGSEVQLQSHELARLPIIGARPRLSDVRANLTDRQKHRSFPVHKSAFTRAA